MTALAVIAATATPVFSLDPLPCADELVEGYRRAVRSALPVEPRDYDRIAVRASDFRDRDPSAFADPYHLAAPGHRLIADLLIPYLSRTSSAVPG